eukprot:365350-Chlamydomonas_euryale.AAC.12
MRACLASWVAVPASLPNLAHAAMQGRPRILVCTDAAARGLDVADIAHVVQVGGAGISEEGGAYCHTNAHCPALGPELVSVGALPISYMHNNTSRPEAGPVTACKETRPPATAQQSAQVGHMHPRLTGHEPRAAPQSDVLFRPLRLHSASPMSLH